jgi:hypothetical protein
MVARVAVPALAALWERRIGLEIGAGQIVQQHVEAGVEQVAPARDQMLEQRVLVCQQQIMTGIELVDLGQGKIRAQQIRQRAAREPLPMQAPLAPRRQQPVRRQHQENRIPARPLAADRKPRPEPVELQLPP